MGARYYDETTGRFLTPDPVRPVDPFTSKTNHQLLANPQRLNRYTYGLNNPYKFVDPDGEWAEAVFVEGPSIAVGIHSFVSNVKDGNIGSAIVDAAGIAADSAAAIVPGIPGGVGLGIKAKRVTSALARYNGPKPKYHVNPQHVPGPDLKPGKTPLPSDASEVYRNAVPNDPINPTAWFGKNKKGQIYRYSSSNDGTAHFSGMDGVGDGVRNLTNYAKKRLKDKK